ncbi:hypothetical protein [Solibacillus cecembensis]|uniref:hypothetical protein n=1 Tax=Solibacillus cecembensis TaxID=459347 RepID=UPI003CFFDC0B
MSHFEIMEAAGQTNIFDFITITPTSIRNVGFMEGDSVKIRFYEDEVSYINNCHPQLLNVGEIVGKQHDFYLINMNGIIVEVPGEKLVLV